MSHIGKTRRSTTMDDKDFLKRVPSLEQMNKTNADLTQGGFDKVEVDESEDGRSYFDGTGAARRRGIDDKAAPGQ